MPRNRRLLIIAFGKAGDDYYFGKATYITGSESEAALRPEKMSEAEFRAAWKSL